MLGAVNNAINEVFLGGRFESRPLYLVLDKRGREQLADLLDRHVDDVQDYCCRIVGEYLSPRGDPYAPVDLDLVRWKLDKRRAAPPFTAVLFALSHAAELMVTDGDFSAGNYYNRLSGLVNVPADRLSLHGRSTQAYWNSFSRWLADNDFRYGRPTARAVNGFKYVGIAVSQAIVREVDRRRFHEMFEKYGFTGTDEITETEVEQYVANWINTSRPTKELKAAWAKAELRPRICESVVDELEDWKTEHQVQPGEGIINNTRLSLALTIRNDIFSRSLNLWLGKEAAMDPVDLSLSGQSGMHLGNFTFGAFATIEPRLSLQLDELLLRGARLETAGGQTFTWAGRAAIPLSRSVKGNYWTEVNRVSLGVEHVMLVRADRNIRSTVERALQEVAAPGYTVAEEDRLPGLPTGWLLYEGVRVVRALEQLKGFESVLSPVASSAGLQFFGGVSLGRGIWHSFRAPKVVFDSEKGPTRLQAWDGTSSEDPQLSDVTSPEKSATLCLSDCFAETGNVYLEGSTAGKVLATASVLLRSADRARPLDRQLRGYVGYSGVLQTASVSESTAELVRGLIAPHDANTKIPLGVLRDYTQVAPRKPLNATESAPSHAPPPLEKSSRVRSLSLAEQAALPCPVRGYHVLKYDYIPPGTPKTGPVNVACTDCTVAFIHRPQVKKKNAPPKAKPEPRPVPPSPVVQVSRAEPNLDMDLWFDAACFLGAGTLGSFEAITAASELDAWRTASVLRDLMWLGHLDLQTSQLHRVKTWCVAPPSISIIRRGEAVLSGFRNRALVDEIQRQVIQASGKVEATSRPGSPLVIRVRQLEAGALEECLSSVRDPHGRALPIVENAGLAIAAIAARQNVFEIFRPATLGRDDDLQKFDVSSGRWRLTERSDAPGAYRLTKYGAGYYYRGESGQAYSGPYALVKLAAARLEGVNLHAYSESETAFTSRLGCEPLGLLGRSLVTCSGELPAVNDGVIRFGRVSPDVAAIVLTALYNGELPS